MCGANECCFFVKLDLGCVLIGFVSFIFSITMITISAVYLAMPMEEEAIRGTVNNASLSSQSHLRYIVSVKLIENFEIPLPTLHIILCSTLVLGLVLLMASISLLIGLIVRRPGFILFYFGFGIFFVIFTQLGGLLMLLQKKWEFPMIIFILSIFYIHFLVVVHTVYEDMLKRLHLYVSKSVERLVEDDTISTISTDANDETPPLFVLPREVRI